MERGIIGTITSFSSESIGWSQAVVVDESHNCLWVGITINRWDAGTREVASMTYDGDAMTKDGQENLGGEDMHWQWWYLFNPSTGSNTLAATHSGTGEFVNVVHAVSLGRIDVNVVPRTPVGNSDNAVESRSAAVTTEVGDLVMAMSGPNADRTIIASAGSIELAETYGTGNEGNVDGWAGYRRADGISTAVGCEWSGASKAGIIANAFAVIGVESQVILVS